jgi:hypothetical protein
MKKILLKYGFIQNESLENSFNLKKRYKAIISKNGSVYLSTYTKTVGRLIDTIEINSEKDLIKRLHNSFC